MIRSPQNKQVKEAQKLQRKRRRAQSGLLLIEGQRLIRDARMANIVPNVVFYSPEFEAKNETTAALIQALHTVTECLACTQQVINALADTVTPQGVVAVVPQPALMLPPAPTLTLILDQVRDPGNVGTLLRSAEAAGVGQVLFAPNTADPFNEKVVRAAMGAHFRLPIRIYETWQALLTSIQCKDAQRKDRACEDYMADEKKDGQSTTLPTYLADAHAELSYDKVDWCKPSALIVGGEAAGASEDATRSALPIAIPMYGGTESLNAGVAGSIILFEAARQRREETPI